MEIGRPPAYFRFGFSLNVSPSTVSRALKDNPDISQETRDLIHAYAREHNYKPNVLAVNLRASRSNTIGVIVHNWCTTSSRAY